MSNQVLDYFYQIMNIPRETGNEFQMVEFLKNFAIKNNLEYHVDNFKNVLIKKNTSNRESIILQAHSDMVCVQEKNLNINFKTDPIIPQIDGDFLKAKGTSLGADNGIGLCMILSLLKEDFPMNVEALITSEEETTMNGAKNFDTNILKSKNFLSLDGSIESEIDIASASVMNVFFDIGNSLVGDIKDNIFSITVSGLIGGHSGEDIEKNRGHAFKILLNFLNLLEDFNFVKLDMSEKLNVIPTYAKAYIETKMSYEQLQSLLKKFYKETFLSIYAPKLKIEISRENNNGTMKAYYKTNTIFNFLKKLKYEVVKEDEKGFILLSANLHLVDIEKGIVGLSVRGANQEDEDIFLHNLESQAKAYGYKYEMSNHSPFFKSDENSEIIKILKKTHKKIYNTEPKIKKIHAGLEAGVFFEKKPDLEIAVIAPKIDNLHSTSERVSISSIDRTYEWLKLIVKEI